MVDSIQGNSRVNSVGLSNIQKFKQSMVPALGLFGFGPKASSTSQIDMLEEKFNFNVPKYKKGIQQLTIKEADYIPDKVFKENELCEV